MIIRFIKYLMRMFQQDPPRVACKVVLGVIDYEENPGFQYRKTHPVRRMYRDPRRGTRRVKVTTEEDEEEDEDDPDWRPFS